MAKQPIINLLKNLVKNYDDFVAVKGISFEVYDGEIFGLLGPNGAGKTTTLEIIETLRDKTSGEVTVDGLSVSHDADKLNSASAFSTGCQVIVKFKPFGTDPTFCGLWDRQNAV